MRRVQSSSPRSHFLTSVVQFVMTANDSGGASAAGSMTMNRWPSEVTVYWSQAVDGVSLILNSGFGVPMSGVVPGRTSTDIIVPSGER